MIWTNDFFKNSLPGKRSYQHVSGGVWIRWCILSHGHPLLGHGWRSSNRHWSWRSHHGHFRWVAETKIKAFQLSYFFCPWDDWWCSGNKLWRQSVALLRELTFQMANCQSHWYSKTHKTQWLMKFKNDYLLFLNHCLGLVALMKTLRLPPDSRAWLQQTPQPWGRKKRV